MHIKDIEIRAVESFVILYIKKEEDLVYGIYTDPTFADHYVGNTDRPGGPSGSPSALVLPLYGLDHGSPLLILNLERKKNHTHTFCWAAVHVLCRAVHVTCAGCRGSRLGPEARKFRSAELQFNLHSLYEQ